MLGKSRGRYAWPEPAFGHTWDDIIALPVGLFPSEMASGTLGLACGNGDMPI